MKRLVLTLVICLGCMGILGAQNNIWKPINGTGILGVGPDGTIFAYDEYGKLTRSQDEGETWQTVLGQETGFIGHINSSCFAVSNEGRICVFNDNQQTVVYSDDNGDTWQQTPTISQCGMPTKAGICTPTNDIFVVWAENGEIEYSLDGGETWDGWVLELDEESQVGDMIVNAEGDAYVSAWSYSDGDAGIFHSTLSDMQNWEFVAAEGINIMDMAFDPEGNVVACGWKTEGSVGFQHTTGFYLFDGTSLAIGNGGIVYTPRFMGLQAVLSYSTDHGEHFTEIGEHIPLVDIAPGGDNAHIFKGADNHLYFDGGGEYWKSVSDADHIRGNFPLENSAWVQFYRSMYEDSTYYQLGIKGDTLVNETTYKKVINCAHLGYPIEGECFGGIREDEDGKCYFMSFVPGIYAPWPLLYFCEVNTEYPLYDFSLSVCDVFQTDGGTPNVVVDTAEMQLNGSMRKVLWFGNDCDNGNPYEWQWIEGIGSTHSLLYPIQWEPDNGPEYRLVEVWQDEELLYRNPVFDDEPSTFAPQGAEWYFHVLSQGPITQPPFYYIKRTVSGVEEIQGHTCSVIDLYDYVYEEDNVVYWYNQTNDAFTVLYDFNAEAGESWICDIEECSFLVTVQSVDNVTWNNRTYRTQYVAGYYVDNLDDLVFEGRIIDGIGYEKGLFPNWGSCGIICGATYEYMRCYLVDGNMLYHGGSYDCDYVPSTSQGGPEWYYEILNENGSITYQYMYQAGDTVVQDEPTHILVKINTLYDKGVHEDVTHEYVYERDGKLYWWNKTLEEFTVLYDLGVQEGDSWVIKVGTESLPMHVDAVEYIEYEGVSYRVLHVSDPDDFFSGDIVCGIGHLTSFFPERLMRNTDGFRVEGLRCYWVEDELVFKYGDEDCDAIYEELHGVGENTENQFNIYPNPTNDILFVETRLIASLPATYRITNLMGQTIMAGQITAETQQIDVATLPKGMYFITVGDEMRKFVVNE